MNTLVPVLTACRETERLYIYGDEVTLPFHGVCQYAHVLMKMKRIGLSSLKVPDDARVGCITHLEPLQVE